jgi:hypothetical protein
LKLIKKYRIKLQITYCVYTLLAAASAAAPLQEVKKKIIRYTIIKEHFPEKNQKKIGKY